MFRFRYFPRPDTPAIVQDFRRKLSKAQATGDLETVRALNNCLLLACEEDVGYLRG